MFREIEAAMDRLERAIHEQQIPPKLKREIDIYNREVARILMDAENRREFSRCRPFWENSSCRVN